MSKEKPKPYTYAILVSIIIITVMSVGTFILLSGRVQREASVYSEVAGVLDNYGNLATEDINVILLKDSIKYDESYSNINDLILLNNQYQTMIEYNLTHPLNYTQKDFDEIKMEFDLKMRLTIDIVQSSNVYIYGNENLGCNVTNNYTYLGFRYYFILNQWFEWGSYYEPIHPDIFDYVNNSFALSGNDLEIPEIKIETWAYNLYNNLSMLKDISTSTSYNYIYNHKSTIDLNLVNLSLETLSAIKDGYISLIEKSDNIINDLNNATITLALAGVLMGFAISFDNLIFRKISLIIGLLVLALAIVYFTSAFSEFLNLANYEASLFTPNDFVFS